MKQKLYLVTIFFISFLAGILYFGGKYFTFGISIEQLLFVIVLPITGTDDAVTKMIVRDLLLCVVLPSIFIAIFITFLPKILQSTYLKKVWNAILTHRIGLTLCISVCFFIIAFNFADSKLQFSAMINNHFFKPYSAFYEEHYIKPNAENFTAKNPRNLIVIIAESMESTFSGANVPQSTGGGQESYKSRYSPRGELIPNLTRFAKNGVNFSANDTIGGHLPNVGSAVTNAATISYLCAFPWILPKGGLQRAKGSYFANATCIGNVLDSFGYNQVVFTGADGAFGGYTQFIKNQHFEERDMRYFVENGYITKDYSETWGIKDYKLFSFVKKYLDSYNKNAPFALYISTVDTHFPGFVDREFCKDLELNYENAIRCGDRIIGDFVEFVRKSHFGKNTTIVIVGDHLTMERDFISQGTHRYIYNVFINPHFSVNPSQNLTKNRELTHYDITALILDSIGFKVESFGLGRNPLYGKTLIEQYGIDEFNELIMQPSKIYESF